MWEAYTEFHEEYLDNMDSDDDETVYDVLDAFAIDQDLTDEQRLLLFYSATNEIELEMANSVENLSARYYDSYD